MSASQLMTTTLSDGVLQLLNVPPAKRFNESMLQDSREEPPKVIPKPCDSGSEDFDASESKNEETLTVKLEGGVIPGTSNIAPQSVATEPTRTGIICQCSKCAPMKRQDQAAAPAQGSGMEDKENQAVKLSGAPFPDKCSEWDDALAFSTKEVKRPAAKQRLPFSDTPVRRNASLVPQVKGTIRNLKPRYEPGPHQMKRSPLDQRVWLRSDSSSRRTATDNDM